MARTLPDRMDALTLVRGEDWLALYDGDGTRIAEGHALGAEDLAGLLGIPLTVMEAPAGLGEDAGGYPGRLTDVRGQT